MLHDFEDEFAVGARPAWARVWHVWELIIPRFAINGAMVRGRVWRRHDGRRWIYKHFAGLEDS
jgi:hypothetical protein